MSEQIVQPRNRSAAGRNSPRGARNVFDDGLTETVALP